MKDGKTSQNKPYIKIILGQGNAEISIIFWEKFINDCKLNPKDIVKFYHLTFKRYFNGCLEYSKPTRIEKLQI